MHETVAGISPAARTIVSGLGVPLAASRPPEGSTEFAHPWPAAPEFPHGQGVVTLGSSPSPKQKGTIGGGGVRSYRNTSSTTLVSPGTRLLAWLPKTTKRPSEFTAGSELRPLPCAPVESTLIRTVVPVCMSWRNVSRRRLVSPATRL